MGEFERDDEVIELRHYFSVIYRYKWRILALSIAITMLAAVVVYSMKPVFRATATMMIEAEPVKALSIEEVYGLDSSRKEYLLTQFEIIKSKRVAERIVEQLDLVNSPEFDPDQKPKTLKDRIKNWLPILSAAPEPIPEEVAKKRKFQNVTHEFSKRLSVMPVSDTQLVRISFESLSPEFAAEAANMVAMVYIENQMEAKLEVTRQATGWLNSRLEDLRLKTESSELALQKFQEEEGLVDVEGVRGLASQQLNEITTQLLLVRKDLNAAASLREMVRARGSDIDSLSTMADILNHSVIQDVKRAEVEASRKVSEMSRRYGPLHPKMIAAKEELATVEARLRTEVRQLVAGIESDYEAALANEKALVKELADAKSEFQRITRKGTQYSELQREVDVNSRLYDAFLNRFKETKEIAEFESPNARLVDKADAPQAPAKPRKKLILFAVFMVSAVAGVCLTFVFEALNDSIRTSDDVETKLGQPMVGLMPFVPHVKKEDLGLSTFFDPAQYKFSESIRTLRTGLLLSHLDKPAKVIAVTSSMPGEGKTTVSENLAFALAQMENVLLIDTDMRHPSIGKHFGLPANHPGLSNLIAGVVDPAECIHRHEQSGLDVLPAGIIPPNPQELLASVRFMRLLKSLMEKYDRIVLDTAPAQVVSDALLIARWSDSMLFVVKADGARQKVIRNGITRLLKVGANLDGVVLNQVDTRSKESNYGEFYGYYGSSQTYGAEAASAASEISGVNVKNLVKFDGFSVAQR